MILPIPATVTLDEGKEHISITGVKPEPGKARFHQRYEKTFRYMTSSVNISEPGSNQSLIENSIQN